MEKKILLLCVLSLIYANAGAQDVQEENLRTHYGFYSDFNWNFHTANFKELPGVPNCCPSFDEGQGFGATLGLLHELPLSEIFSFDLRGNLSVLDATLRSIQPTTVILNDQKVDGSFEHSIRAQLASVAFEPLISYNPIGRLHLHAGFRAGIFFRTKFSQKEQIVEPNAGLFENMRRVRNEVTGEIPNANTLQYGLLLGASHEAPLNRDRTLFLAPEIFYQLSLSPVVENLDWRANSLRFGIALKYAPADKSRSEEIIAQIRNTRGIALTFFSVRDSIESPLQKITLLRTIASETRPLLNYIFFDENSYRIPQRYHLISAEDTKNFSEKKIFFDTSRSSIPVQYYDVLNVIGSRLQRYSDAKILLTGIATEKENSTLGLYRAEAIASYLQKVWALVPERVKIQTKISSPAAVRTAANDISKAGEEARRVEISSDDERIFSPIVANDTALQVAPEHIRFKPALDPSDDLAYWSLRLEADGALVKNFDGSSNLPVFRDWHPELLNDFSSDELRYNFSATTIFGLEFSQSGAIPVEKIFLPRISQSERFNLILFDLGSAELGEASKKIIPRIKSRLSSTSQVQIVGYTDVLGDAATNKILSLERAKKVAQALGVPEEFAKGAGEEEIFDNLLPEGRFYNRTVRVIIERNSNQ